MISKHQISPWSDNFYSDFQTELKQTILQRSVPLKKRNKFFQMSQRFTSESEMPKINSDKLSPKCNDSKQYSSISLTKNNELSSFNPQKIHSRIQKRILSRHPTQQREGQIHQMSERGKRFLNLSTSSNQKISEPKKPYFQSDPSQKQQNLTYIFALCEKQKIRWRNGRKSEQESFERDEIFKKVDQISRIKKKQIKLPKIAVAYSMQRILH